MIGRPAARTAFRPGLEFRDGWLDLGDLRDLPTHHVSACHFAQVQATVGATGRITVNDLIDLFYRDQISVPALVAWLGGIAGSGLRSASG